MLASKGGTVMDYAAYVFYVNRPDFLRRSVDAFSDLRGELTVVDNSHEGIEWESTPIFRPPVPMTYSQSTNWMLKNALLRGVDFILHFHSDAFCTNPDAVRELLGHVRENRKNGKRWGCAWTFYDILWAINPVAMREIGGWDTAFPSYFTDQDVTRRLTMDRWLCENTGIEGIGHAGSTTIKSNPTWDFVNGQTFSLYREYYIRKHGGPPGEEIFIHPFNQTWMSWKDAHPQA